MVKLYSDADYWDAYLQRRKILAVFLSVTGACLLGFIALTVAYTQLPYRDPAGPWIIAATCVLVGLYMIFAFPFAGIKFKRCNSYCKMLKFISVGMKEHTIAPFLEIEDWITRDGVDCNVAVFAAKNIKKDELLKRQIYIDGEKEFPPFEEGKLVHIVSQGNLLIEYELLE